MCKLCLGAVLIFTPIFSFSATLPSGYTELEYIESTGTQYIDTGVVPANGFGFEIDVMPLTEITTTATPALICGSSKRNGGWWGGVMLGTYPTLPQGQATWFKYDTTTVYATMYDPGFVAYTRCTMKNINNHFTSSTGKNYNTPYVTDSYINGNLYLFAINTDVGVRASSAGIRLYSCKLYNGTTVIRNFIPAKRNSDNVVGLYDTVNNIFYTNSGTGTFNAGPVVLPCGYTRLEYIESTGTQHIDTGVYAQTGSIIEVDFQITSKVAPDNVHGNQVIYGNTPTGMINNKWAGWVSFLSNPKTNVTSYVYDIAYDVNGYADLNRHTIRQESNKFYLDNNLRYTVPSANFTNSSSVLLFVRKDNSIIAHMVGRIYSAKIWSDGTNLSFNGIPAKRNSDGAIGMYDTVTKTFFTNAGTGTFIAGPELAWENNCSATISITWGGLSEPDASGMCVYGETFTAPSTAPTAPSGLKFLGWRPM